MTLPKCHNCRRHRLRCDSSIPGCNKCAAAGQQCLGYGQLYRWTDSVASRGRMMGKKTFDVPSSNVHDDHKISPVIRDCRKRREDEVHERLCGLGTNLIDPLFQDLDHTSRRYLNYFVSRFCQDLVVHDSLQQGANPFRDLIPLSGMHTFLRHIIVATSAIHFSSLTRYQCTSSIESGLLQAASDSLVDALRERHKAIKTLQHSLKRQKLVGDSQNAPGEKDALFATIIFFINFALIDTGRDDWRAHMKAAGKLIEASNSFSIYPPAEDLVTLSSNSDDIDTPLSLNAAESQISYNRRPQPPAPWLSTQQSSVLDCTTADFIAYYVWSGTLDTLTFSARKARYDISYIDIDPTSILPVLKRTEAISYHSCPAHLLLLILRTSLLARDIFSNGLDGVPTTDQLDSCAEFLLEMQSFDVQGWADEISARNFRILGYVDEHEVQLRMHIASTYRATACLYMLLVAPSLPNHICKRAEPGGIPSDRLPVLLNTEEYAATILEMLSYVSASSPLFKYTTWPVWMTGVETALPDRRAWVMERLQAMMVACPWGMLKAAMESLAEIWRLRDADASVDETDEDVTLGETSCRNNWLVQLRSLEIDCLIV